VLPTSLKPIFTHLPEKIISRIEEIRLRIGKPLALGLNDEIIFLTTEPGYTRDWKQGYPVTGTDITKTLQLISNNSLYALEQEFRHGYLTLPGGHRVGFVGEAVLEKGRVKTLKHVSSLNIRLARQLKGCADPVMPYLLRSGSARPYHTLIISPPRCGKTTLLRDIVRQLSDGVTPLGFTGTNIGLVDERSELAGCFQGVPQNEIGIRTDVLDNCPKAEGMILLLRSMSPQVVATDEIGQADDIAVLEEMLNAGIAIITTVHGLNLHELELRPAWHRILNARIFERYVVLGRTLGPGTIETIIDGISRVDLSTRPLRSGSSV
jgi:stage III sporulation protein AA